MPEDRKFQGSELKRGSKKIATPANSDNSSTNINEQIIAEYDLTIKNSSHSRKLRLSTPDRSKDNKAKQENYKFQQQLRFQEYKNAMDNAVAHRKMYFDNLTPDNIGEYLLSGEYLVKKSEKLKIKSVTSAAYAKLGKNHLSDNKTLQDDSDEVKERDELNASVSARVEREHKVKLFSPPRNIVKNVKGEGGDELLSKSNEVLHIIKRRSDNRNSVNVDDQLLPTPRNKVKKQNNEYDLLRTNDMDVSENISTYGNCHNMIRLNSRTKPQFEPILHKGRLRSDTKKDIAVPFANKLFKAIPVSYNPIQISADQKEFGLKTCCQCEMIYMPNDAENDMLHTNFHNNMLRVLTFNGWKHENLINKVKEWGNMGRIIWLNQTDVESRVMKMKEILAIVDKDLGFANLNLPPDSIIYLAISRKLIIGVCVAEHLKQAHLMSTENQVEYIDTKTDIPVKCGISRIWVTPQYRRYGVATRLIQAVCSQFEHGHILPVSEIAFRTPTVICKSFAQKFAGKVFIYDPVAT